jgi:hypothetical protein
MRSRSEFGTLGMALSALVAVLLGACGSTDLLLVGAPGTAAGMAQEDVAARDPVSFGSIMLCLSRPGTAVLRSVAVHGAAGDIEVQAFAVRLNPFLRGLDGLGDARSTITGLHTDFDPDAPVKAVSGVCPEDPANPPDSVSAQLVELAVQVVRGSGDAAGGPALDVVYDAEGSTRTAIIPFGVWLCATTCPPEAGTLYKP